VPDFSIPHLPPIRFVKSLLYCDSQSASVKIAFEEIPTLAMLVEAAAQSSSGIEDDDNKAKMGFLVSLKNVELLQELKLLEYTADIELVHKSDNFKSLLFTIKQNKKTVAKGTFSIALQ